MALALPAAGLRRVSSRRPRQSGVNDHFHFLFWSGYSFLRLGGIDCMIFSALPLSSTECVYKYLGVRSFSLVIPVFLFFLIVILSGLGRFAFSLLIILMNSFRSLISLGCSTHNQEISHWSDEPTSSYLPLRSLFL